MIETIDIDPTEFLPQISHFFVRGEAGLLEALSEMPKHQVPLGVGIVCHPNPQQEGSMTHKVVYTAAKAFSRMGLVSVRFNYRGVGRSEGAFGETLGEIQDLLSVIQWVKTVKPNWPVWLAGFSFGAYIAAQGALKYPVVQLITIAPAVHLHPYEQVADLTCPWLVIQGDQDEIVSASAVQDFCVQVTERAGSNLQLVMMPGIGHFFHGRLAELRSEIESRFVLPL